MGAADGRRLVSPFVENEKNTQHQTRCTDAIVPLQFFAEISDGEDREHGQRNYFLDGLELRGVEFVGADTVCRYLETIFEKCDSPTGDDDFPESLVAIFQVAIPREGHKDIGDGEKQNGAQFNRPLPAKDSFDLVTLARLCRAQRRRIFFAVSELPPFE
jgi:hypothetical protein